MNPPDTPSPRATIVAEPDGRGSARIKLAGRLDAESVSELWPSAERLAAEADGRPLVIDVSEVAYCDGAGMGLLVELHRRRKSESRDIRVEGLSEEMERLLRLYDPAAIAGAARAAPRPASLPEEAGRWALGVLDDIKGQVVFVGELSVAMARAAANPRRVRWADAWLVAEKAGVNAVPIASLIGFIVGLVIAFQSAIPMQQFGVEIYVADLIGLGMLRELGPLMTAIVLVSRSGSAFAAEIGTMKVNQEIDALTTMGLDPVRFLVVPRVIGISAMTPFVTIIATLAGILGGMIVIVSFGYPVVTYFNHVLDSVDLVDFTGGVFKAWVLGVLVGAVGCLRGLQTESGAGAVGDAATSAVVSGIVLITVVDGVFAVAFYYLGI